MKPLEVDREERFAVFGESASGMTVSFCGAAQQPAFIKKSPSTLSSTPARLVSSECETHTVNQRKPSPPDLSYGRSTNSDKILRYSLWKLWGECCYWCGRPLDDSTYAQIDHILPQSDFREALRLFPREPGFQLHSAENLAPICEGGRRCNQKKPEKNLQRVRGAIEQALAQASDLAPQVRTFQTSLLNARGIDKALVAFITGNLDQRSRRLAADYGKDLVQKLYEVFPSVVTSYSSSKTISGNFEPELPHDFQHAAEYLTVKLNSQARFAFEIAERLHHVRLEVLLGDLVDAAIEQMNVYVEDKAERETVRYAGRSDVSPALGGTLNLKFTDVTFTKRNKTRVRFRLQVAQEYNAQGYRNNEDGGLNDVDVDWNVDASFILTCKLRQRRGKGTTKVEYITLDTPHDGYDWIDEVE